ncbi:unnamed protein product [Arabidopsis arenosa]|uniref:Uncharacterized protein n=1 Tax=Arabidopsis arenosa TaxID=38785 RepID=A0A8S1ZX70_ARAAE|nr:unnamed protein product [Arabidopsis arenosa]
MIMFSPYEVEPLVWPSVEKARDVLDGFFALPEIEKKKKEMSLESYLKEKTKKVHEQMTKTQKKNMNYAIAQLMAQLHHGRKIHDLNLSEIYALISFLKDNIIRYRKRLDFVQYPSLRDPPVPPFEVQFEEFMTTTNDAFVRKGQEDERVWKTNEAGKRISIGAAVKGNQTYYLLDKWVFPSSEPPNPRTHHQIEMNVVSGKKNPNHIPNQGKSINKNSNLETVPVGASMVTFNGLVRSVSQPSQYYSMNYSSTMAMSQPRQYPFDFKTRELGVKEEGNIVNNGDLQFHRRSNTTTINDRIRKEPPRNGTTVREDNDGVTSFDMNKVWSSINNNHS